MISRVAESCFWLFRYLERVDATARILAVHRSWVLDLGLPELERWYPLVIVLGEQKRFDKAHSRQDGDDGEVVQKYFAWNEDNPVSILNSTRWARENARMVREVVSPDMWEALNGFWHWMRGGAGKRVYRQNRDEFYHRVIESVVLFQGLSHNTMLHEEPFDFMRLGMLLERAGQTTRALDIKHHAFGPTRGGIESHAQVAQWSAILACCGATELFLKRADGAVNDRNVAEFVLLEPLFPRSILHCVDRSWNFLQRIRPENEAIGEASARKMRELLERLCGRSIDDVLAAGLHAELTQVTDRLTEICAAIHADYFDPPVIAGE